MIPLLALGLGLDSFAVSVTCGIGTANFTKRHALMLGFCFGAFQAGMFAIGTLFGDVLAIFLGRFGDLIVFGTLTVIGGNMIWGAVSKKGKDAPPALTAKRVIALGFATSIDALAAGIALVVHPMSHLFAAVVIGVTACSLSIFGGLFGCQLGKTFSRRAEFVGGAVLVALGITALF